MKKKGERRGKINSKNADPRYSPSPFFFFTAFPILKTWFPVVQL